MELRRILAPFQELVTGSRPGIPVESISSSAFGLELLAVPAFGYAVARAINEILTVYKNVLEFRKARQSLKESGVPDDALAGVDDHANQAIDERNDQLAQELVEEFSVADSIDEGRRNEVIVEIRMSLNAIANRIDMGYEIDVRAPKPPEEPADGEGEGDTPSPDELAPGRWSEQDFQTSPFPISWRCSSWWCVKTVSRRNAALVAGERCGQPLRVIRVHPRRGGPTQFTFPQPDIATTASISSEGHWAERGKSGSVYRGLA